MCIDEPPISALQKDSTFGKRQVDLPLSKADCMLKPSTTNSRTIDLMPPPWTLESMSAK